MRVAALSKHGLDRHAADPLGCPRRRSLNSKPFAQARRALSLDGQGSLGPLEDLFVDALAALGHLDPGVVVAALGRRLDLVLCLDEVGRLWRRRRVEEGRGEGGVKVLAEPGAPHGAAWLELEVRLAHGGHLEVEVWVAESHGDGRGRGRGKKVDEVCSSSSSSKKSLCCQKDDVEKEEALLVSRTSV